MAVQVEETHTSGQKRQGVKTIVCLKKGQVSRFPGVRDWLGDQ